jgi:hypothetical protein
MVSIFVSKATISCFNLLSLKFGSMFSIIKNFCLHVPFVSEVSWIWQCCLTLSANCSASNYLILRRTWRTSDQMHSGYTSDINNGRKVNVVPHVWYVNKHVHSKTIQMMHGYVIMEFKLAKILSLRCYIGHRKL